VRLLGVEILLEVEKGRRTKEWLDGAALPADEGAEATRRLVQHGFLEARPEPVHYLLTEAGRRLLANIRAKIGPNGRVDWTKIDEVDFPRM
jgi:hypothetical protein